MFFSPLVEQAARVAALAHAGQYRKASDLPYFTHLAGVAIILLRAGFDDEEVLAAAMLHDVVEDTDCTIDQLKGEFPERVTAFVAASTERKRTADGRKRSWRERKEDHIREVANACREARAIVLADKLHNLGTMLFDLEQGEELWSRFGAKPAEVIWYHTTMTATAAGDDSELEQLATACRAMIDELKTYLPEKDA